ncbi:hypothetical protein JTB14_008193 [Gonioctena quinquepunctata]|nr:hypothetical protein JTB14_008193 [Gonioctena quinquepunctata]
MTKKSHEPEVIETQSRGSEKSEIEWNSDDDRTENGDERRSNDERESDDQPEQPDGSSGSKRLHPVTTRTRAENLVIHKNIEKK